MILFCQGNGSGAGAAGSLTVAAISLHDATHHGGELPNVGRLLDELTRLASHQLWWGAMAMDVGALTPFFHAFREREAINDIMEKTCGARLTMNYMCPGGVAFDLVPLPHPSGRSTWLVKKENQALLDQGLEALADTAGWVETFGRRS